MRKPRRSQIAEVVSIPAPVGGLNGRDALAEMPPKDAVVLDNLFPLPSSVSVRNGSAAWTTGGNTQINSLCCYASATARKLFAAAGAGVYDVTTAGALGAASVSGMTSDKWQHTNFGTPGGQYLYLVNGADSPQLFNGTTWQAVTGVSAPVSITGVTTSLLVHICAWKQRLFFIENNSMRAWYLPVTQMGGVANSLDMTGYCSLGGYLMAAFPWTIDNANGSQEYLVFITSEGEVLVFAGSDPGYSTTWVLTAQFRIGRPQGRRCFVRIGADVGILSADGLFPLSQALLTDRTQRQDAISDKIVNLINNDVQTYSANFGWQVLLYPIGNKLVVNVPAVGTSYQYVMNTVTGAWCRFTGWSANCFEQMGDKLFFANTNVYQADTGGTDNGAAINAIGLQAFQDFGTAQEKQFTMGRPVLSSNANIRPGFSIQVDYDATSPTTQATFAKTNFTPWNSPWGSVWSSPVLMRRDWQGVNAVGFAGAASVSFATKNATTTWQSTDVSFIHGGVL